MIFICHSILSNSRQLREKGIQLYHYDPIMIFLFISLADALSTISRDLLIPKPHTFCRPLTGIRLIP